MKLYDFHCNACGKDFEDLVQDVADARCPACKSGEVKKEISAFAVGSGGGSASAAAPFTGGCGGGMCGTGGCPIA